MISESPGTEEEKRKKADQASRISYLTSLVSNTRGRILSLASAESSALTRKIEEKESRLKSVAADGSDFSSSELSTLEGEIKEINERVSQETRKLALLEEISKITTQLAPIKSADSPSLMKKINEKKMSVEAVRSDGTDVSSSQLSFLEDDIDEISRRTQQEFRKSILLDELSNMRTKLSLLEDAESSALVKNIDDNMERLGLIRADGTDFSSYELSSLQADTSKIEEKAEAIDKKQSGHRNAAAPGGIIGLISQVPMAIWLALIPVISSIYLGYLGYRQSTDAIQIPLQATKSAAETLTADAKQFTQTAEAKETLTAEVNETLVAEANETLAAAISSNARETTVSFINPRTNPAPVELVIKDR